MRDEDKYSLISIRLLFASLPSFCTLTWQEQHQISTPNSFIVTKQRQAKWKLTYDSSNEGPLAHFSKGFR
ncbi:hypothetical protein FH972_026746 [Carpinus fangiana]|uniref:Uncharacterized protein n=1 Tax=Carpinus fangiana TaxID=176857 RepID=A0A5N6L5A1_9ROSI|nr:hypothetical protein FH972_026746 [Carpinus fangiana]